MFNLLTANVLFISHEMCLLVATIRPRTGKIINIGLNVFERRENLLQNGILDFCRS